MGVFLFVCFLLAVGVYLLWRAVPFFSAPWRVRIIKDSDHHGYALGGTRKHTVSVVLQKRMTYEPGFYGANRVIVKDGIPVTDDPEKFAAHLKTYVVQAEEQAKTLRKATRDARRASAATSRVRKIVLRRKDRT